MDKDEGQRNSEPYGDGEAREDVQSPHKKRTKKSKKDKKEKHKDKKTKRKAPEADQGEDPAKSRVDPPSTPSSMR